ncbi:MAG: hypothetical protein JO211_03245 [Acidobacteriaceae bacterium]|nr:hypothetical protein [Acidobacteriaceae bacterium]
MGAVAGIFMLSAGNLLSVFIPRRVDPAQTFRRQAGGRMQLWFLVCAAGLLLLVAFAFLAQWALESHWALLGVLAIEFLIGVIIYRIALDSAVEHGVSERERILDALSKGSAPIGLGL